MPESKGRPKKAAYTPPPTRSAAAQKGPSPHWYAPLFIALLVVGLLWVVVFYVTSSQYPISAIGYWNLAIGFALMMMGFLMTMNWR